MPLESAAADSERRFPVVGLDVRSHLGERLGDAIDGPPSKRVVAGQLEATLLPGEDPGKQSQRRAGVSAVDRLRRFAQSAQAGALDPQHIDLVVVDGDAERADGRDRGFGVCRAAEALDPRLSVGDRTDQHRAVRDRLVAGHGDVPANRLRRLDLHSDSTGETTTP